MIHVSLYRDRDRLESSVWMDLEFRDPLPVIHAKPVFYDEIVSQISAGKRDGLTKVSFSFRIHVLMMSTEKKRIVRCKRKAESFNTDNFFLCHFAVM